MTLNNATRLVAWFLKGNGWGWGSLYDRNLAIAKVGEKIGLGKVRGKVYKTMVSRKRKV